MKNMKLKLVMLVSLLSTTAALVGCTGGGSSPAIYYPYQTVYGSICSTYTPTPGCTFSRSTGARITVTEDPDYNRYGHGSDDMWYVKFDGYGYGDVYDQYGNFRYTSHVSNFAGWVGGNSVGVGTSGFYWENISWGTYWIGYNDVLYSANMIDGNYGEAVNDKSSGDASDTNLAALKTEANKNLVDMAAKKLMKEYGFKEDRAQAIASSLNAWAIAAADRGYTTDRDMDKTFKTVFGVDFRSALSAVQDLKSGNAAKMRELANRSASELGIKPDMADAFIKDSYRDALAEYGYNVDEISW